MTQTLVCEWPHKVNLFFFSFFSNSWPEEVFRESVPQAAQKIPTLGTVCELNMKQCSVNEICTKPAQSKRRDGVCMCQDGFVKNPESGFCVAQAVVDPNQPKKINVQVYPKIITLPENKALLTAYAIPGNVGYRAFFR